MKRVDLIHTRRGIEESLADFERGRHYGPFDSAKEAVDSMKKQLRKRTPNKRRAA